MPVAVGRILKSSVRDLLYTISQKLQDNSIGECEDIFASSICDRYSVHKYITSNTYDDGNERKFFEENSWLCQEKTKSILQFLEIDKSASCDREK
jgi:hypothetical protein